MSERAQDVVERLRKHVAVLRGRMARYTDPIMLGQHDVGALMERENEAADEITEQDAEITRLRAELERAFSAGFSEGTDWADQHDPDDGFGGATDEEIAQRFRAFLARQEAEHGEPSVRQMINWMRSRPETENWGRAAEYADAWLSKMEHDS